jgi:hypothetical protein
VAADNPANTGADGTQYASGEYALGADADTYDDNDPAALTDFHGALDAHGAWADDPRYGTVWVPNATEVGANFTPYSTAGHWVVDDGDNYVWVSDYDWGWAPFHYGRWVLVEGRGWVWIPGRVYRGAWVEWGWDDGYGYVGWYPMVPAWFWFGGAAVGYSFYVGPRWVYCPRGEVFSPVVGTRIVAGPSVASVGARVHVSATPGVGPAPAHLGLSAAQVPHLSGAAAANIGRAQQFGRPSTAVSMGASPRTATSTPMGNTAIEHSGAQTQPSSNGGKRSEPEAPSSATQKGGSVHGGQAPAAGTHAAPAPASGPSRGGGSGGGGGHGGGGGGHHR